MKPTLEERLRFEHGACAFSKCQSGEIDCREMALLRAAARIGAEMAYEDAEDVVCRHQFSDDFLRRLYVTERAPGCCGALMAIRALSKATP